MQALSEADLFNRFEQLNQIGIALSRERDLNRLLEAILVAAQNITVTTDDRSESAPAIGSATSMRVYSVAEQDHMGAECLGFISFLEGAGVLPPALREIVVDRAMAAPDDEVCLDTLKIIVLMVYWRFGHEPDALILDELCDDTEDRVAH